MKNDEYVMIFNIGTSKLYMRSDYFPLYNGFSIFVMEIYAKY